MNQWEYKMLLRTRPAKYEGLGNPPSVGTWSMDMEALLPGLGKEGWELVSVVARSSTMSGITDGELWVLKRPCS